ncbi:hypothetical protein BDV96DRAFT_607992 [Lophiotrema nucula]|uniref:feruloyl esterase n=1 Tax=Lophiotrema nucula TaxID=690887 RepID=A0A6A5YFE1_9PLEO|nr:hypothetical protein BDV96DRAFT_607992 [Lophiotrema nucula]
MAPLRGSAQKIVHGEHPNKGGALPYRGLKAITNNIAIFVVPDGLKTDSGADLCINTDLRFSMGFSYGGAISYTLACAQPEMPSALAVISGAQLSGCSGGTKPVAYYGQHGTKDSVLTVSQGRALRDKFVTNNGCTKLASEPRPNGENSVKTVYTGCKVGYPLTWVIHDGDHNPLQMVQTIETLFAADSIMIPNPQALSNVGDKMLVKVDVGTLHRRRHS